VSPGTPILIFHFQFLFAPINFIDLTDSSNSAESADEANASGCEDLTDAAVAG